MRFRQLGSVALLVAIVIVTILGGWPDGPLTLLLSLFVVLFLMWVVQKWTQQPSVVKSDKE